MSTKKMATLVLSGFNHRLLLKIVYVSNVLLFTILDVNSMRKHHDCGGNLLTFKLVRTAAIRRLIAVSFITLATLTPVVLSPVEPASGAQISVPLQVAQGVNHRTVASASSESSSFASSFRISSAASQVVSTSDISSTVTGQLALPSIPSMPPFQFTNPFALATPTPRPLLIWRYV